MSKDFFTKRDAYVARAITLRTLIGIKNISVIFDEFCYGYLQSEEVREDESAALILIEFMKEDDTEDGGSPLYTIVCSRYDTNKQFFDTRTGIKIVNKNIVESISLGLSFICHTSQVRKGIDHDLINEASSMNFLRFTDDFSVLRAPEAANHKGMSYGSTITHNMSGYLVAFQIALYVGDKPINKPKKEKQHNKGSDIKKLAALGERYVKMFS